MNHDEFYTPDLHQMSSAVARADKTCRYDLDDADMHWLNAFNGECAHIGE